ncbi:protein argonaute-2-like [Daphnia carinata]|uniref:protein argonaute-2-like n=1 Tax=Daphnia carinata TaxID=120202 RepID=UPI0028691538|nr:protein argonaute-2-like [Daphnia carinata]
MTRKRGKKQNEKPDESAREGETRGPQVTQAMEQLNLGPQTMQQHPAGPSGGQQRPAGPPGGQQRPAGPPGGQQHPVGPPGIQQRPAGPPGIQQRPTGPPGIQQRPTGPPGIEQRPAGPPGIQQRTAGPPGIEQRTAGPPGGQHRPAGHPGLQQRPFGPPVLQQRPAGPQSMQQHPIGFQGVQEHPTGAQGIRQQRPAGPQGMQQHPTGQQGMQQRPVGPQDMQQRPAGPQGVQQRPAGPRGVQQRPAAPQGVQQRPAAPQGVQQRPAGPQGVQQRPAGPQGVQQRPVTEQRPAGPQTYQQSPAASRAHEQQPVVTQTQTRRPMAQGGALRPPPRQDAGGVGTLGRPIALSANHFGITMKKQILYHYDVDVKPLLSKTLFRKVVEQFLESDARFKNIRPVFDSKKNIYTACRVPGLDSKMEIKFEFKEMDRDPPRINEFTIYLQPTGELEIDLAALASYCQSGSSVDIPLRPIQALDIAMKYGAAQRPTKVMLGSCLLSKPTGRAHELGGGVEVWFGHFQSIRLGWKPFLNVDATQRAFMKSGKVHLIMAEMFNTRTGEELYDRDYMDFSKKIATLKVSYNRGQYIATVGCNGLKGSASTEKFECDGQQVTVQQYFEKKLNMKLQYPYLPCVWVGSREKKNLVPMELCSIAEGQEYRRKLSDFQTSAMIKVAATPADVRKQKILDSVRSMQFDRDPYAQNFGISVDSQMAKIQGRVLPTPKLVYGEKESTPITPRDGVWNMRNMKFIEAKSMNAYGILNITRCQDRDIEIFVGALTRAGREMGMTMGNPLFNRPCNLGNLEKTMKEAKQKFPQLQIIFVIINRKGDPAYEIVKRVGDLDLKITTQCIQQKNVQGRNGPDPSTMANICLKLNAKLGGINNLISRDFRPKVLLEQQVIIMGADVTHPGADQQDSGKPSIAAVVGSVDPRASQYCCEIRIQKSKQEYIEDMENMVYNLLRKFNKVTGSTSTGKPQRIIFYRDGVSEGQFAKVLEWELSAIRRACMKLENGYNPPVTFIVVQKRHHTRLFPENPQDECGRGKNVPPGTIVDNTIVHPVEQDFFLVSHQGIQGTSRPTHYHVLWDDAKLHANEIQMLTYYMCYLFTRCTRSVSYPAPCYYSHLVAFRGRQYYDNLTGNRQSVTSSALQSHIDSTRDLSFMFFV